MRSPAAHDARLARIEWSVPPRRRFDALFGPGATRTELLLVFGGVLVTAAVQAVGVAWSGAAWAWWQWLTAAALILDVVGGVIANSLGTAKRFYTVPPSAPPTTTRSLGERLTHDHVWFTAFHVHPFVVAALWPDGNWGWAASFYVLSLGGVIAVRASPVYLQRPIGMGVAAVGLVVATVVPGPALLAWVGPALVLKLVVAHSVSEAPFRPNPVQSPSP